MFMNAGRLCYRCRTRSPHAGEASLGERYETTTTETVAPVDRGHTEGSLEMTTTSRFPCGSRPGDVPA